MINTVTTAMICSGVSDKIKNKYKYKCMLCLCNFLNSKWEIM